MGQAVNDIPNVRDGTLALPPEGADDEAIQAWRSGLDNLHAVQRKSTPTVAAPAHLWPPSRTYWMMSEIPKNNTRAGLQNRTRKKQ